MPRPVGWRTATIEEIAEKVGMGPFGSSIKVETFVPEGIPIISGQHLHGARLDEDPGFKHISPEHAQRLVNSNVFRGDIVLTHRGTLGQVALIPDASKFERYIVSQSQFYIRCDRSKVDPEFVTLYLKSPEGQHQLLANSSQVGVPSIAQPVTYLRSIEIPIPPLPEQHDIAHILGTLDDKIELNRRMNRTLEEMARAIYKDWFVDFGPVRAKLEGRAPYLPLELWDLFPNELVDSELGEIPEGWEVGELRRIATFPVRTVKPQELSSETVYIGLEHMPRKSVALNDWETAEKVTSGKLSFHKGEFLFGKLRPYFHKVGMASTDGICSTDIVVVAPRDTLWSSFVLLCISTEEFVSYTDQTSNGTRMPRTNWKTMGQYKICIPPKPVAREFQNITQNSLNRTAANIGESRLLSRQRDALLPHLLSGEVMDLEWETSHAL